MIQLAYDQTGKGLPMVLLHGYCCDRSIWSKMIEPLSHRNQVLNFDLPGHGESPILEDLSLGNIADVLCQNLESIGIHKYILVGHSMGGYIAMEMLARQAERISGLTLFHSHPFEDGEAKKAARIKSVGFLKKHGKSAFLRQLFLNLYYDIDANRNLLLKSKRKAHDIEESILIGCMEAMRNRPSHEDTLKSFEKPIEFLMGKDDQLIPVDLGIKASKMGQNTVIHVVQNMGHMGMHEDPKQCAEILRNFSLSLG